MRVVYVTVGPRGSGKSTFCKRVVETFSLIELISRDEILIELFGTIMLGDYGDGHFVALEKMWERVAETLKKPHIHLILDCWNGFPRDRISITEQLREYGADRIVAWYFTTPLETCLDWFLKRENSEGEHGKLMMAVKERNCRHDYELYHSQEVSIDQGFDEIVTINPCEHKLITLFRY